MSTTQPAFFLRVTAAFVAVILIFVAWHLADGSNQGRAFSYSLVSGAGFGLLLQRSRFCFFCVTRDFIERRIPDGLLGVITALAVGTLGYYAIFGAFVPDPSQGRLPPDAHIGPISWVLALAAAIFGIGMAISGSCISAHLYRIGEGHFASISALLGAVAGFVLGFICWNPVYLSAMQEAPVVWLPNVLGYAGSLALQLVALGTLTAWLLRYKKASASINPQSIGSLLFGARWPTWVGGGLIGALAVLAYFRVAPLGVTAELGSLARTGANQLGLLPERLQGLDGFSGCATVIKQSLLSNNGLFVIGLVTAAWASAMAAGDFKPARGNLRDWVRGFFGGALLGFGSLFALGCTVGTLLSGVMAGAASGWVFGVFCVIGIVLGLKLRPHLKLG